MTIKIAFELNDSDLEHFREIMVKARDSASHLNAEQITSAAAKMLEETDRAELPAFIQERLGKLRNLIAMVHDGGFGMTDEDKRPVLAALTYFADPEDVIPDSVPVLGYLDDAIMIELVVRELRAEIEAYHDFCAYRSGECARRGEQATTVARADWAESERKQILSRMRRRRRRGGYSTSGSTPSSGSFFGIW